VLNYEKELQEIMMEYGDLYIDGNSIYDLESEVQVGNGYVDIMGVNHEQKKFYILELKLNDIDAKALCQIIRYICDFKEVLVSSDYSDYSIYGYLVGKSCKIPTEVKFLKDIVSYVEYKNLIELETYKYVTNGEYAKTLAGNGKLLSDLFPYDEDIVEKE
jgi:hypothetical protein